MPRLIAVSFSGAAPARRTQASAAKCARRRHLVIDTDSVSQARLTGFNPAIARRNVVIDAARRACARVEACLDRLG